MACYASVLSLYHTLNNIKIHPRPPISLNQKQLHSLTQNLTFLLDFLESYPTGEDENLESRIAAAAYSAEDVIETHIVDRIHHAGSTSDGTLYQDLGRAIVDMDMIKKEVKSRQHHHLHTNSSVFTDSVRPGSTGQSSITERFDDVLIVKVLDKLTGQQEGRQVIPIVGMGGIGKTTLAKYIYSNQLIVENFDIRAWVMISQEYSRRSILQSLYQEICKETNGSNNVLSEDKMGEKVYKTLCRRSYLIVMDDIWSVEAWDQVKHFFPNNGEKNRIMITTRLSNLAFELSGSHDFRMQFLDEDKSWNLLCDIVFGKLDRPIELEDIGKEIARNCRGLPLSIAVIGGLLTKSNMTRVYWEYCLQHLNSLINLDDNEYCLQVLRNSYKELPIHLKPCFLYMAVFPEDFEINVTRLIKLWVSEGILKPNEDKSLEEVAMEYLKELIERNMILVHEFRLNGEVKICKIHDLLRDVCSREAERQKFLCVIWQHERHPPLGINMERRICINHQVKGKRFDDPGFRHAFLHAFLHALDPGFLHALDPGFLHALDPGFIHALDPVFLHALDPGFHHAVESTPLARSLLYDEYAYLEQDSRLGLLRVCSLVNINSSIVTCSKNAIFEQANMRYLFLTLREKLILPSSCSLMWNLQTLEIGNNLRNEFGMAPSEIWEMPLLRHAMLYAFILPDPPHGEDNFILENLQTLFILNLKLSEEVIKRIPNIKTLEVRYRIRDDNEEELLSNMCLNNLCRLHKLESLKFQVDHDDNFLRAHLFSKMVSFPHSLKKLILLGTALLWDQVNMKIGSLPHLQHLGVHWDACLGPWKTVEGQFCSLRVLDFWFCRLEGWDTDEAHFPRLEHLLLRTIDRLEEIPSCIGDISTLKSIRLDYCTESVEDSAKRIKQGQVENGDEQLQLIIGTRQPIIQEGEEHSGEKDEENCSHEEDEQDSSEEQVVSDVKVGHRIVKRSWKRLFPALTKG